MKRKIVYLLLITALALSCVGFAACQDKNNYTIEAPADVTVELGNTYNIPSVEVGGAGGAVASYEVKDAEGNVAEASGNRLSVNKLGFYTIRYYYAPEGDVLAEDTQKITVSDTGLPYIELISYETTAVYGETYPLPEVNVLDTLGEVITPEITITRGGETQKLTGPFTVESDEDFTITVSATNSRGNTGTRSYEVYVRKDGEFESADREWLLSSWNAVGYQSFTFNTDPAYVKEGEGSFHFVQTGHDNNTGRPKIKYVDPAITDWSGIASVSFWVYNNGDSPIDIETLDGGSEVRMCANVYPGMWTKVTVTKAQLEAFLVSWLGMRYNLADMTEVPFAICFYSAESVNYDVYIDEFTYTADAEAPVLSFGITRDIIAGGQEYTCKTPDFTGKAAGTIYNVYDADTYKIVPNENGKFTAEAGKNYEIIATVKDESGAEYQARYTLIAAQEPAPGTLVLNEVAPTAFSNMAVMSATASSEGILVHSDGWGTINQRFAFYASSGELYTTDLTGYTALSVTVVNMPQDGETVLKFGIGNNNEDVRHAFSVPADGLPHTYIVPIADYGLTGVIQHLTLLLDSDNENGAFVGDVLLSDIVLVQTPEVTFADPQTEIVVGSGAAYVFPAVTGADGFKISAVRSDGYVLPVKEGELSYSFDNLDEAGVYNVIVEAVKGDKVYTKSYTLTVKEPLPDYVFIENGVNPFSSTNWGLASEIDEEENILKLTIGGDPNPRMQSGGVVSYNTDFKEYDTLQITLKADIPVKFFLGTIIEQPWGSVPGDGNWYTLSADLDTMGIKAANGGILTLQIFGVGERRITGGHVWLKDFILVKSSEQQVQFAAMDETTVNVSQEVTLPVVTGADSVSYMLLKNGAAFGTAITDGKYTFTEGGSYELVALAVKDGKTLAKSYALTVKAALPANAALDNYALPSINNTWGVVRLELDDNAIKLISEGNADLNNQTVAFGVGQWLVSSFDGFNKLSVSIKTNTPVYLAVGKALSELIPADGQYHTLQFDLDSSRLGIDIASNLNVRLLGADGIPFVGEVWLKDFTLVNVSAEPAETPENAVFDNNAIPAGKWDWNVISYWNDGGALRISSFAGAADYINAQTVWYSGDQWRAGSTLDGYGNLSIRIKSSVACKIYIYAIEKRPDTGAVIEVAAGGDYQTYTVSVAEAGIAYGNNFFITVSGAETEAFAGNVWLKDFVPVA